MTLRDRLGHRYIDALLHRPFEAIPTIAVAAAERGRDVRMLTGSRGESMSAASLAELKKRAADLREDLDEARENSHAARQETILTELERIAGVIRGATGKDGTPRRHTDAERVRVAVTNAIHRSIWSIGQQSTVIAAYFRRTIQTGYWLQFRPQSDERWS
ncbi:MAG: hypothetical protein H0X38_02145 [Planctomycetes bacterium]|nr:hypothetical protein [Planctomycetota bacterium]